MVLEAATAEDDSGKGPSKDSLESSDSSKVSSKQCWPERNLAVDCFAGRQRLAASEVEESSRWIPLEPPPLPRFWVADATWALPAAVRGDFKAISGREVLPDAVAPCSGWGFYGGQGCPHDG